MDQATRAHFFGEYIAPASSLDKCRSAVASHAGISADRPVAVDGDLYGDAYWIDAGGKSYRAERWQRGHWHVFVVTYGPDLCECSIPIAPAPVEAPITQSDLDTLATLAREHGAPLIDADLSSAPDDECLEDSDRLDISDAAYTRLAHAMELIDTVTAPARPLFYVDAHTGYDQLVCHMIRALPSLSTMAVYRAILSMLSQLIAYARCETFYRVQTANDTILSRASGRVLTDAVISRAMADYEAIACGCALRLIDRMLA